MDEEDPEIVTSWSGTWVSVVWVLVVLAYAGLSSVWTGHEPGWYANLRTPAFQPPDWVFGVVWPLNFAVLLVVGVGVGASVDPAQAGPPLVVLSASVLAALRWAWLFYVPHRLRAAAVALAVATVLTWTLVVLLLRAAPWAGVCLVPYAAWLSVATALSVEYARNAT